MAQMPLDLMGPHLPAVHIVPLGGGAEVAELAVGARSASLGCPVAAGVDLATDHVGGGVVAGHQHLVPSIAVVLGSSTSHAGVPFRHHHGEVADGPVGGTEGFH